MIGSRSLLILGVASLLAIPGVGSEALEAAPVPRLAPPSLELRSMNQAPVSVITVAAKHPYQDAQGQIYMVYQLKGTNSYDPDGSIASYLWYSNCAGYSSSDSYSVTVYSGTTCHVTLWVYDNLDAEGESEAHYSMP